METLHRPKEPFQEPEPMQIPKKRDHLARDLQIARKQQRAYGSFDLKFWTQAAKIEKISLEKCDIERRISLRSVGGTEKEWIKTDEAKRIFERIRAHDQIWDICQAMVEKLDKLQPRMILKASSIKVVSTAMGMAIKDKDAGNRVSSQQDKFRTDMIEAYEAKHPAQPWLWCPMLGDYADEESVQACQIFPYIHGQDAMDAIFGKKRPEELFSPLNGLLLSKRLGRYFDAGKFVIVPDISENTSTSQIKGWFNHKPQEYRVKVIDPDWEKSGEQISRMINLTFGELDGRKLVFRSRFRPTARYLYFHYCVQTLRMCWQHRSQGKSSQASVILQAEKRKPLWGCAGRYLPRNMLSALVEEMGDEYQSVLDGATGSRPDDKLLLALLAKNVKARPWILAPGVFQNDASEDEFSDEVEDSDEEWVWRSV